MNQLQSNFLPDPLSNVVVMRLGHLSFVQAIGVRILVGSNFFLHFAVNSKMIDKVWWSTFSPAKTVVFAALMITGAKINCRKDIKTSIACMNLKVPCKQDSNC